MDGESLRERHGPGGRPPRQGAVSDFLTDSAPVARAYCPGCEPDADPIREILDVRWCERHTPERGGSDDVTVNADTFMSGSAEAGGDSNRRWCEVLHRGPSPRRSREEPR